MIIKKRFKTSILIILITLLLGTFSLAVKNEIIINRETVSFINKEEILLSNFDNRYNISYNNENNHSNKELNDKITEQTKKITYLLLGKANSKEESGENYYKRHQDYLNLKYNPEIPKDPNSITGLDQNSQEYIDDAVSGISVAGMFSKLNELDIKYSSYGEISVSKIDENNIISSIKLPSVKMKEQDKLNSMNYNIIQTDLTIYYYLKKLNDEYKLYYLYAETNDDINKYLDSTDEKYGSLSKNTDFDSKLKEIYNFEKANAITDELINNVYNENKDKIVYLNSTYNFGTVVSANGFFINNGIIVTTYTYLEKSLIKAQNILINDSIGNAYELEGIVTINIENDIAVLKVKNANTKSIKFEETSLPKKEDGIISIKSQNGVGLTSGRGITTTVDKFIQTSLPISDETQGSPLFNSEGKLIGMMNSKNTNSSISYATNLNILKEYNNMFSAITYNDIKAISFESLKENYYIKYDEEDEINSIPKNKLKNFSNIENAIELIDLKLVKSSCQDKIVSLRFKNDISNYIDTMQFASEYIGNLKNKGYKEKAISDLKTIFENDKYQIIVMKEFDYLIIVMVRI